MLLCLALLLAVIPQRQKLCCIFTVVLLEPNRVPSTPLACHQSLLRETEKQGDPGKKEREKKGWEKKC